jgi:hypothetical protein
VPVVELTAGDWIAACARFTTAVLDGRLVVRNDPTLTTAVLTAERRRIGERWVWDRSRPDAPALTAATMATWQALEPAPKPVFLTA